MGLEKSQKQGFGLQTSFIAKKVAFIAIKIAFIAIKC